LKNRTQSFTALAEGLFGKVSQTFWARVKELSRKYSVIHDAVAVKEQQAKL